MTDLRPILQRQVLWLYQPKERLKPAIGLLETPQGKRIIKDFSGKPWFVRKLFAPIVLGRECRIYRRLKGVKGIPAFHGLLGKTALLLEYIPGVELNTKKRTGVPDTFFDDLKTILAEMHERGVAHGDLRLKNILVTEDWRPYLIDFATSICWSNRSFFLWRRVCEFMKKVDCRTLTRLKSKIAPQCLTQEDRDLLSERMGLLDFCRWLRKRITKWYK